MCLMRPATFRACFIASLVMVSAAISACEHGITLDITVDVPVEVQELYSATSPGTVWFGFDMPKTGAYVYELGSLCEPAASPLTVSFVHDDFGCAKRATAYAWVEPPTGDYRCGLAPPETTTPGGLSVPTNVPQGSVVLFPDNEPGRGCVSGDQTVTIEIQP